jgi:purine-nucleoside phosphorylase
MNESKIFERSTEAAAFVKSKLGGLSPKLAIVLGSGLGAVAEAVESPIVIPYTEIPHFPHSTAPGHGGRMVAGTLGGVPVLVMQGRVHFYEGYTPQQVTFPMRVLGRFGIKTVILTNAAGGVNPAYSVGQLVLIADHINYLGFNPAVGPNDERIGVRFYDMTEAYSKELRAVAKAAGTELGMTLVEGVYLATTGPSYETPAEIRAFGKWGADLVGMSTVPETIIARHEGMKVLGISCVSNLAAGLSPHQLTAEEVFETGKMVQGQMAELMKRLAGRIAN